MTVEIEVSISPTPDDLSANLLRMSAAMGAEPQEAVQAGVIEAWRRLKTYEAPRVEGYQRTGEMSRQTVWQKTPHGAAVEMRAAHSKWVRGSMTRGQAWMHRGRWQTFRRIIRESLQARQRVLDRIRKIRERFYP